MTEQAGKFEPDFQALGFHNLVEVVLTVLFPVTSLASLWYCFHVVEWGPWTWAAIPVSFVVGYAIADFITGVVHWAADTYCSEETPWLGPNFIHAFRWHHIDPKAMCKHSFSQTVGNSCFLAIPVQGGLFVLLYHGGSSPWLWSAVLAFEIAVFATVFGNIFHKWAHLDESERPRWVTYLQKLRLVLEPGHHSVHHTSPFETYYCVTNGWTNWVLHKLNFWRNTERFLGLLGILPDESSRVSPEDRVRYRPRVGASV